MGALMRGRVPPRRDETGVTTAYNKPSRPGPKWGPSQGNIF